MDRLPYSVSEDERRGLEALQRASKQKGRGAPKYRSDLTSVFNKAFKAGFEAGIAYARETEPASRSD